MLGYTGVLGGAVRLNEDEGEERSCEGVQIGLEEPLYLKLHFSCV